jgi:hypothetical protein
VKPGLQRNFEIENILTNANLLCNVLADAQHAAGSGGVMVQGFLQRYTISNVSKSLLQTDFEVGDLHAY